MDHAGLCGVVLMLALAEIFASNTRDTHRRLQLRNVCNMPTHARCSNKATITVVLQLLSHHVDASLVLPSEDLTSRLRAVEYTVKICRYHFVVRRELAINHAPFCPWNTSVSHEDVKTSIEVASDVVNCLFSVLEVGDIYLICLA